ncbi:MAG: hypothetical protein DWQ37_11980 [Planctomycetota bacterium]|nr:MAG: hypothetical protein DWQ37_11980 [Planctomycetota bacterium]
MKTAAIMTLAICGVMLCDSPACAAEGSSPLSWIGFKPKSAATAKGPSLFEKMSSGTKRFFGGTKKMFADDEPTVTKKYGTRRVHRAEKPKQPQQSFFGRLFNPQPAPPPRTIEEWMALEQVHP